MPHPRPGKLQFAFGLFFLTVGSVGTIGGWGAYARDTELVKTGTRVEARIVSKRVSSDADDGNAYLVRYRFSSSDGRSIEGKSYLSRRVWSGLSDGASITVVYSPTNPRRNFPEGGGVTSLGMVVAVSVIFGVVATMGGALIVGCFRKNDIEA